MPHPNDVIEPRVGMMFRMPESIHKACKAQALKARRSLTDQLLIMIEDWLEEAKVAPDSRSIPTCQAPVAVSAADD